ncbi:TraM recognition domain-containing protein [Sessilibacter corallicola]|uniref:TraM recognition domain-containing protein n=1 Tax=Sessilibacter corallicola TaxID=2904075 RepID=UPI001E4A6989|nr:TraM recognition domain-containing protein [Sessilibacter corallicola]MCE2029922.1 TraM recognition domain-containing protein [Sessilibacter corallicola]
MQLKPWYRYLYRLLTRLKEGEFESDFMHHLENNHNWNPEDIQEWPLDMPLLYFSDNDPLTLRDAYMGIGIFGATGSGKTSSSGQAIARAFLRHNLGGLVICSKHDEAKQWLRWAKQEKREKSIIHVTPDKDIVFNFLKHEMSVSGGDELENILEIFNRVMEITAAGDLSKGENSYFYEANQELLRNAITLSQLAYGEVTLLDMYNIVRSAPMSKEEAESASWMKESDCGRAITFVADKLRHKLHEGQHVPWEQEFILSKNYFLLSYPGMGDRLRSSITSIFSSSIDPWLRGKLWELFSRSDEEINPITGKKPFVLKPQYSVQGAIILFDYPAKTSYVGKLSQSLYKLIWQRQMERRDINEDGGRGVFLFADEAQIVTLPQKDAEFAQTARSSRVITTLISQNISNYHIAFGDGQHGVNQTESLFGNIGTLIFHANTHDKTNGWASDIIGSNWSMQASTSHGDSSGYSSNEQGSSYNSGDNQNVSYSEQHRAEVEKRDFTLLTNGGKENNYYTQAIVTQAGRIWSATETNYMYATFYQYPELNS